MDAKKWFICFVLGIFIFLLGIFSVVIFVDPYFHYHKPVSSMFYVLNNQRSQNDGMIKHFEYDSIITGTSMSENFKTSEFDEIFQANSIKVCFSGGSYKEINANLEKAFESGHNVKYILRCLDYSMLITDKDRMRSDLGEYPTYLYDKNIFNDVKYILNKEIIYNICIPMLINAYLHKTAGGITSFDEYSNWNERGVFGAKSVLEGKREYRKAENDIEFTDEDRETVNATIEQNVIELAKNHPETTFYYFFPPYSIAYWGGI